MSWAVSGDNGAGCGSPSRSHQLRMAVRRATLGTRTSGDEEETDAARSAATAGGEKASAAQAWMQARSKVWPGGTTTGSAIREPEIGQRNSAGGSAVNDDDGDEKGETEGVVTVDDSGGAHQGRSVPVAMGGLG